MGATKEMFLELRAEDFATMYDAEFSKKKATSTGENLVNEIFDNGEVDPLKVFSNIVRLNEVISSAVKTFRERLSLPKEDRYNGVTFTPKNGSEKLNLSEDLIYSQLEAKLKERGELVKLATKSKDVIYDSEGCEVGKVSSTFSKGSITVTF